MIVVSLNVDGGVRLIKPAKLYMCMQNTTNITRTDARRQVCAAMAPSAEPLGERHYENWNTHTHTCYIGHLALLQTSKDVTLN